MYLKLLFLYLALNWCSASAQVKLLKYSESGNTIKAEIALFPDSELSRFDESNPGQYSFPRRNIILGIPFNSNPRISYNIKECRKYKYNPLLNPDTSVKDSIVKYDFKYAASIPHQREVIEFKGYLNAGNIQCISLDINYMIYDDVYCMATEISVIEILLVLSHDLQIMNHSSSQSESEKDVILNYKYAVRYAPVLINTTDPDSVSGWIDYSKKYIKIKIAEDGIYRIRPEDLAAAGLIISEIDPSGINLYKNGKKIPVYIKGEYDHVFDPGDYIEFIGENNKGGNYKSVSFYNQTYQEYRNRYTDTSIYWLTWNESEIIRAELLPYNESPVQDTLKYYKRILHFEKDNWFDYSADILVRREHPFWIENKTWGWNSISPGTAKYNFTASDILPYHPVKIWIKLQSYASDILINSHQVGIGLNNSPVLDSVYVNKYDQKVLRGEISPDNLFEGSNTLKVYSFPTSASINLLFFDWFEVEYYTPLKFSGNQLRFSLDSLSARSFSGINISNASGTNYTVWKKEEHSDKLLSFRRFDDRIYFADTIESGDIYYASGESEIRIPLLISAEYFSNLRDNSLQADYIIITNKNLMPQANSYAAFIENYYSLKSAVINVEKIYDEFSFGHFNPEAIRDFLKSTHEHWQEPFPKYVLLAGDGTYDYHRNKEKNLGNPPVNNFVPSFGAPVSDSWFVIWDTTGSCFQSMNIGRLPVTTPEEFLWYLEKHKNYIAQGFDDWNKSCLFFSGGTGFNQQELDQLKSVNDLIISNYAGPAGYRYTHFYKTIDPVSNFGQFSAFRVKEAIDNGGLFISYIGHSGTQTWDNGIVDPRQLKNSRNRYPLITDFGCSTGKFAEPDITSFAELFINGGDAIAYIGNSSLGFFSTSTAFPLIFYKKILSDSVYNISEAHRLAKMELLGSFGTSGVYTLFAYTNTFFGDPVISLKIPGKPDLCFTPASIQFNNDSPDDRMESAACKILLCNYGKFTEDSVTIQIEDIYRDSISFSERKRIHVPLFCDSLVIDIPIKNLPGEHRITVSCDMLNEIDELNENNNFAVSFLRVWNSSFRLKEDYAVELSVKDTLEIFSPVHFPGNENFIIEISRRKDFSDALRMVIKPGIFVTRADLKNAAGTGHFWIRGKAENSDSYSFTRYVNIGNEENFLLNDSVSFKGTELKNLIIKENNLAADTICTSFSLISAGYNDGKTAVISKNGQTYVPGGNLIGHHVCLFRESDLEFVEYRRFNLFGETLEGEKYYKFLDSLTSDYLVMIAVNDDGRAADSIRRKLHEFGSLYIDSLGFRSSWALIGKRGSPRGSVPEFFKPAFQGKVEIDTVIKRLPEKGTFTTGFIGPAEKWKEIFVHAAPPDSSSFKLFLYTDTLKNIYSGGGVINISGIIPREEKFIKLKGKICRPGTVVQSLGVTYFSPPEIMLSRGAAFLDKDTAAAGDEINLSFDLFNGGESDADSFFVTAEIKNQDGTADTLFCEAVNKIAPGETTGISRKFAARGEGKFSIILNADARNRVNEIFEDNNSISLNLIVTGDETPPVLSVFSGGREVSNGFFLSGAPALKIVYKDNLPVMQGDTSFIKIILNKNYIPFSELKLNYNPSEVSADFNLLLKYGTNLLEIEYSDASGNSGKKEIELIASDECRISDVYNYPDPFAAGTNFTFILTQIPDELKINIYTIAGRLIRTIYPLQLSTDFNSVKWDGCDQDGDPVSNGVYFYKIIFSKDGKSSSVIQKMAKIM